MLGANIIVFIIYIESTNTPPPLSPVICSGAIFIKGFTRFKLHKYRYRNHVGKFYTSFYIKEFGEKLENFKNCFYGRVYVMTS